MKSMRSLHGRYAALVLAPLMASSLSGCVNLSGLSGETQYACAAPEGVACQSVSGTYANAIHQNLPSQRRAAAGKTQIGEGSGQRADQSLMGVNKPAPTRQPIRPGIAPTAQAEPTQADPDGLTLGALRSQVRVLRLWTKPWEDADGDLWDQGYVYVQIDDGQWQIDHVQQQIRDRYAPLRPPPSALSTPSAAPAPSSSSAATQADDGADASDTPAPQRPTSTSPLAGQRPLSSFPSLTLPSGRPGLGSQGAMGAQ